MTKPATPLIPACPTCRNPTLYRVGQSEGVQPLPAVGGGTEALEAYRCERDCDGGLEHAPLFDRWFVADAWGRLTPYSEEAGTSPQGHAVAAPVLAESRAGAAPDDRPHATLHAINPGQYQRIIDAGFVPGSENIIGWLINRACPRSTP